MFHSVVIQGYLFLRLRFYLLWLTKHADKGIGQQIAVLIGGVALVDSPSSHLHWAEDDGITQHLSAGVVKSVCGWGGQW